MNQAAPIEAMLRSLPAGASLIHLFPEPAKRASCGGEPNQNFLPFSAPELQVDRAAIHGLNLETVQGNPLSPAPLPSAEYALVTDLFDRISLGEVESVLQKLIAARVSRVFFTIRCCSHRGGVFASLLRACWKYLRGGRKRQAIGYSFHAGRDMRSLFWRLNLTINSETIITGGEGGPTVLIDASIPPLPAIRVIKRCILRGGACEIDGTRYPVHRGCWACYVPDLGFKLLYGVGGRLHCTHRSAPDREALFAGRATISGRPYTAADWLAAFSKKVTRRAAENCVAATRLSTAGLGPAVYGCVVVRQFIFDDVLPAGETAGICIDNLETYPRKRNTTRREMLRSGVAPDRINSALRQQIRGYVSDLNSAVGVMPVNAGGEIARIEAGLDHALASYT